MNSTPTIAALPVIAALLLALVAVPGQDPADPPQESSSPSAAVPAAPAEGQAKFAPDRIEQLVAPIALYPDALLAQVLMASTYPLEVVEAARWIRQNPGLSGAALEEALKTQTFDPSVKSLCGFPTVLTRMDEDLPWTRDLGDAFLAQKADLMDAVQRLRKKAIDAGTLKTTSEQVVSQDQGAVVVYPASPNVVYVPTYSPVVVYGPGWYYPTWYYPYWYAPPPYPPPYYVTFGFGFFWGSGCWSHCDWHHHEVCVDATPFRNFHARTSLVPVSPRFVAAAERSDGNVVWTHDPSHRLGVAYRSPRVAERFSSGSPSASLAPRYEIPTSSRNPATSPPLPPLSRPIPPSSNPPVPGRTAPPPIRSAPPPRSEPAPARPEPPPVRPSPRPPSVRMPSHGLERELSGARIGEPHDLESSRRAPQRR
jgi:Protein of unknown function (DUF3300)